jgi:putrescine aminotransferase
MTALWHPFADMGLVAGSEVVIARGDGVYVWDDADRRYLDGSSSLWYANVGHGRREIADAIAAQLERLETFHVFGDFANAPALELAERLAELAPHDDPKVFLTSGGGDSIEAATKLARLFHATRGEPGRQHLISRTNGYHGTHGIGTSILGMPFKAEFGSLVEQTSQVEWDSLDALAAEIDRLGPETIAAFVFEPVIGSGGVHPPPPGYLQAVERLCRQHGILTIADVVIGGFGRLGTWFGVERFDATPDLITFAKGLTSGYIPMGGVLVSARVREALDTQEMFLMGSTFGGHPVAAAVALANLEIIEREDLLGNVRANEDHFGNALRDLAAAHPAVIEVRGMGYFWAIELAPTWADGSPVEGDDYDRLLKHNLFHRLLELGLICRVDDRDSPVLQFSPPLTADRELIGRIVEIAGEAVAGLERSLGY